MSAFLCSPKHIAVVATWAADRGLVSDRTQAARLLAEENVRSVAHYYPDRAETLIEQSHHIDDETFFAGCTQAVTGYAPAQVHKLAESLDYQSCWHSGWENSDAKRIVDAVVNDTAGHPAAWNAPWSI